MALGRAAVPNAIASRGVRAALSNVAASFVDHAPRFRRLADQHLGREGDLALA